MMSKKEEFIQSALIILGYKSKQDIYERLYLGAIIDSYSRISHDPDYENVLRDRFIWDIENFNKVSSPLIQSGILHLDFERPHFVHQNERRRTDIMFFISGLDNFTVECKRLFNQNCRNEEYVTNGLQRFSKLKYSKENNFAAMVGFVVECDHDTIIKNLKAKITSFRHLTTSFSSNSFEHWKQSHQSTHLREDNTHINVYHLFFNFC